MTKAINSIEEQIMNNQSNVDVSTDVRSIRTLNDQLRKTGAGGLRLITRGIAALGPVTVAEIFAIMARFDDFTPDNDPWGEHDCGLIKLGDLKVIWKIDYYDETRSFGSPNPADPKVTVRVLTVMRADEY
jgi:Protein of unknown function (DUF3768)